MTTNASGKCPHSDIGVAVQPFAGDDGQLVLMIQGMRCNVCNKKFRFKGVAVSRDVLPNEPTMRADGLAVVLPTVDDTDWRVAS